MSKLNDVTDVTLMEDVMLRHFVIAGRGQGEAGRGQIPHEDKSAAQGAAGRDHGSEGVLETQFVYY